MVSVRLGARETIREGASGTRIVRPASSVTSLVVGSAGAAGRGPFARGGSARHAEREDRKERGAEQETVKQVKHESPLTRVVREIKKPRENPGAVLVRGLSREGHATSAA